MSKIESAFKWLGTHFLHWLVLAILVLYTYAKFYEHPYTGFRADTKGEVILLFGQVENESALKVGDQLIQVNSERWAEFKSNLRQPLLDGVRPGQTLTLLIERQGHEMQISWHVPNSTSAEFQDLLISEGWLGFFFWAAGTIALLALRPRDERWTLIIAFNYLTALWLVLGSGVSFYHIWGSAILLRMVIWICVPVYLHLHWVYPKPLGALPKPILIGGYLLAMCLAFAEWFQILPIGLFSLGFLFAVSGSFLLLLLHPFLQPTTRRDLRLMLIVALLSLFPAFMGSLLSNFLGDRYLLAEWLRGGGALLGLPLLPLAYIYSAYRRQLGELELRVNQFFSIYAFILLIGTIEIFFILQVDRILEFEGKSVLIGLIASIFTVAAGVWGYPLVQDFVEHRILGIPLQSKQLLEVYSAHITTSVTLSKLIKVLHEEIFPSLLIRQFVFLQNDHSKLKTLSNMGVAPEQIPVESELLEYIPFGLYLLPDPVSADHFHGWLRLLLPLKLGDQTIGFWLFGRRDPDDLYSQVEVPILKALANQTAIALSNILQTERLKAMYESNINRYEQERLRLARDLHDSVLNEMAAMLMNLDASSLPSKFQQSYDGLIARLREIVTDLRPPLLGYGLKYTLEDIADKLTERHLGKVQVVAEVSADGAGNYPDVVEHNLYRIVQEACENALKYARAKSIRIIGNLDSTSVDLSVQDNGIGFNVEISKKLDDMLANKHFGLAGMYERASLIGAEINIDSKPQQGTKIHVVWMTKDSI